MAASQKIIAVNSVINILMWPASPKRTFLTVQNQSTLNILVNIGGFPKPTNALIIPPGDDWTPVNPPKGAIRVTGTAAAGIFQTFYTAEESSL